MSAIAPTFPVFRSTLRRTSSNEDNGDTFSRSYRSRIRDCPESCFRNQAKRGLVRGGRARLEMFYAVWTAYLSLQWNKPVLRLPGNPRPVSAELEYINF